ncbi:hypothetical protein ACFQL1_15405 [Halomicroarcula sp. GCM10025709]|uniref:hypothetical protein n=1 Tax=Halomicroarcula sp. GCM10025709 TaxID=3252669 RepID=UPI003620B794
MGRRPSRVVRCRRVFGGPVRALDRCGREPFDDRPQSLTLGLDGRYVRDAFVSPGEDRLVLVASLLERIVGGLVLLSAPLVFPRSRSRCAWLRRTRESTATARSDTVSTRWLIASAARADGTPETVAAASSRRSSAVCDAARAASRSPSSL